MSFYRRLRTGPINFDISKCKTGLVEETAKNAPTALKALSNTAEREKFHVYDVKVIETGPDHARQATAYGTAVG